jgi:hypothetical protein
VCFWLVHLIPCEKEFAFPKTTHLVTCSRSFIIFTLIIMSMIHLELIFCLYMRLESKFILFPNKYPVSTILFINEKFRYSFLNCFGAFVKNQILCLANFWTFCTVSLVCLSITMPEPHCHYCCFIKVFSQGMLSNFVLASLP